MSGFVGWTTIVPICPSCFQTCFQVLPASVRLVDAVARRDVAADVGLAGADVDDVRVGRGDGDRADRGDRLVVEDRLPGERRRRSTSRRRRRRWRRSRRGDRRARRHARHPPARAGPRSRYFRVLSSELSWRLDAGAAGPPVGGFGGFAEAASAGETASSQERQEDQRPAKAAHGHEGSSGDGRYARELSQAGGWEQALAQERGGRRRAWRISSPAGRECTRGRRRSRRCSCSWRTGSR